MSTTFQSICCQQPIKKQMEEAVCFDAKEMIQDRLKINDNGEEKISGVCS